jgi:hypothetical protein
LKSLYPDTFSKKIKVIPIPSLKLSSKKVKREQKANGQTYHQVMVSMMPILIVIIIVVKTQAVHYHPLEST